MMTESIAELEDRLARASGDRETIDALNALALQLTDDEIERRIALSQRALAMSSKGEFAQTPYARGQASSLYILGISAVDSGNFREGLILLMRSQALSESLPDPETNVRALSQIAWVYFNFGDFLKAFETLRTAQKIAKEMGIPDLEADCLISLGAVYAESGDPQQAAETFERALQLLENGDDIRKRCTALNNLAYTQISLKDFDAALANASRSVALAAQLNSNVLLALTHGTSGQIYLALKNYRTAERFLLMSQLEHQKVYDQPDDELVLDLARISMELGRFEDARRMLSESLESVEFRGQNRFTYHFHRLLSELFEKADQLPQALLHLKKFHEIKSKLFNEETQKSLGNLMAIHQAETWRMDAEIYRLKNFSLRREMSDHYHAVAEMQHLATTDALTQLLNRRHFFTLADYSFRAAQETGKSLCALMIDIDNFKQVNDQFGHLGGDQVLREVSAVIQSCLRSRDRVGRVGGEEFAVMIPESGFANAEKIGQRILNSVAGRKISLSGQKMNVTVSIGAAQIESADQILQDLLSRADQALYSAKQGGKNRLCLWQNRPVPAATALES